MNAFGKLFFNCHSTIRCYSLDERLGKRLNLKHFNDKPLKSCNNICFGELRAEILAARDFEKLECCENVFPEKESHRRAKKTNFYLIEMFTIRIRSTPKPSQAITI